MLNRLKIFLLAKLLYVKTFPVSWLTEPTSLIGLAIIGVSFIELWFGKFSQGEASGIICIGLALLFPEGGRKKHMLESILLAIVSAISLYKANEGKADSKIEGDKK